MKNIIIILLGLFILVSCKKRGINQTELSNLALGPVWKTYFYSKNGIEDSTMEKRKPTFEFRLNSKLYLTKINPPFADTLAYQFLNDYNIKAGKPTITSTPTFNFFIDKIDDTSFHFTLTSSANGDVEKYKTSK